jgi:hypothetical protein
VKAIKRISGITMAGIVCFLLLCTIKDDNGNLALTGPHTSTGPGTTLTATPALIVTPDSMYIGIRESLSIAITVMQDSTLTHPLVNQRVVCSATPGFLSAETLYTDSRGRAVLKMMDTAKARVEIRISCGTVTQTLQIDVTDTPDRVQKRIQVHPEKAVLKADGKDFTTIQVLLMNESNNPIVGQCVQFISSAGMIAGQGGGCANSGQCATDAGGIARATLTSASINDTAFVTVFLVSDRTKTAQTRVAFKGVNILVTADSTNLNPGQPAIISAHVLNGSNEPIPYVPIYFSLGKDSASVLAFVSKDSATGPEGTSQCVVKSKSVQTGTDSIRISAAGATASIRMNVTNLLLSILLDDKILQANASKFTALHITFANNTGAPLANKDIQLKRTYQQIDGKDTSDVLFFKTDALGKCAITIYGLPYESSMSLEVTAFNTALDIASAKTTLSFIASRSITMNAIPTVIQADGTSSSTITVQVKNESYNPMVGDQISFLTTAGVVSALATTDGNGRAVATLVSDRRNTFATVKATLVKDATKTASVQVEFSGVEIMASANPPSINSSGKDTSMIDITLIDAAKNAIVGEPINFSKQLDSTRLVFRDSVTNNRGEARCKVVGTGAGIDTIKVEAAGSTAKVGLNYSSNYLNIDTAAGQYCIANGKDSTQIIINYREGDKITPIPNATLDVSVTIGSMSSAPVFAKKDTITPANGGRFSFYIKNPDFANTATIFVYAKTSSEITTATFQLYFRASKIKWIDLMGTPEVIATNGNKAKITAVAYDSMGNRVKDERLSFNMSSGPGGGEYLDPPTAVTVEDGSAITYLVSGKTPSMFREVWVTAGDLYAQKSDTVKFTIAGPPHVITIRENLITGTDYKDGTFGLPVASLVTDVNGNPVADGTEVTFSCKITGWVIHRPVAYFDNGSGYYCYNLVIDTMMEMLPVEDLNDNYRCDPGEDINGDSVASRGEDIDGDGILTVGPPYEDINHNGKRDYLPGDVVEPSRQCASWTDSLGHAHFDIVFADFNGNGVHDTYEPLIGWAATMADTTYTMLLQNYKATHHHMGFDIDNPPNGVADPKTAVVIKRTVQTASGKAINNVIYGQSDAWKCEVTVWAESQGVRTESPAKFILPVVGGTIK